MPLINCIGLLNQFADSAPEKAVYINSYLPHQVVAWLKDTPTRFIQMSTDCVFAGNKGPYDECSVPDGCSYYDRTRHWVRLWMIKTLPLEILLLVRILMNME